MAFHSFLPRFELDNSDVKQIIKRLSIERASHEASAIPRVVEEIKWRPPEASNLSVINGIDDFIEQPVEETVRKFRAAIDNGRHSQASSTPNPRDAHQPLLNYSIDFDLSSNEAGISETNASFVSDSDSDESTSFFFFRHFFNEAEMENLTQNMIDALQQAGQQNTAALVTGMQNLAAQRKLESIPIFSGDSNCPLVIDEWFKIAEREARLADWMHRKSLLQGLNDSILKAVKKGELKDVKQEATERVHEFQKRIHDMYRVAYGASQQQVTTQM